MCSGVHSGLKPKAAPKLQNRLSKQEVAEAIKRGGTEHSEAVRI